MLASILPGFRHVRAPLIAGYIWMVAVVLFLENEDTPALDWIHDLGNTLTPVTLGVASGVVAYLVGSASQGFFGGAGESGGVGGMIGFVFGSAWAWRLPREAREATAAAFHGPISRSGLRRLNQAVQLVLGDDDPRHPFSAEVDEGRIIRSELLRDLDLLRADVLLKDRALFAEIDRLRAEAEFRFVVVVPLLALVLGLVLVDGPAQSPAWLIGLLLPVSLAVQGRDRLGMSNARVVEALARGLIEWPTSDLKNALGLHPFLDQPGPIAIAHRGGADEAPENTLDAFRAAFALGYRYLETDAHLTRDGVVVAFHDAHLDDVTDRTGAIASLSIAEVEAADAGYSFSPDGRTFPLRGKGVRIPRLQQLLEELPQARFNIDPKTNACVEPLLAIIDRFDAWERVCIQAFSGRRLRRVRAFARGEACTSMGPGAVAVARLAALWGGMPSNGADYALVPIRWGPFRIVTARFVRAAHRAGLPVHVWTVDDEEMMDELLNLGVNGIMTDRPHLLRKVFAARNLPLAYCEPHDGQTGV